MYVIYIVMHITIIKLHITDYGIWVGFDAHQTSYYIKSMKLLQ